jgi:hypothetical protein
MLRTLVTASLLTVSFAFAHGGSQRLVFDASNTEIYVFIARRSQSCGDFVHSEFAIRKAEISL